jgi:hypothetical protein
LVLISVSYWHVIINQTSIMNRSTKFKLSEVATSTSVLEFQQKIG